MSTRKETSETVQKMVSGLMTTNKDYAIGYLESFVVNLIERYVKEEKDLADVRTRMLSIGLEHYIQASK
jgi:hypothetical protein